MATSFHEESSVSLCFKPGKGWPAALLSFSVGCPSFTFMPAWLGLLKLRAGEKRGDERGGFRVPAVPSICEEARHFFCVVGRASPVREAAASPRGAGLYGFTVPPLAFGG
ncbi:hypothetical protein NDU88_006454 [Pleurodeles waltl]|uniref:Uncharacterized protein n=1 Tax=Pleurodeles waltl TaxID=8319 RepID=A0AAV7VMT8_PLEWA|nr:hypothetical protein NDU88_006454 [Pleurodeles waltl]